MYRKLKLTFTVFFVLFNFNAFGQFTNPYYYNDLNANNIEIMLDNIGGLEYEHYRAIWDLLNYSTQSNQILYDQGLWLAGKIGGEYKATIAKWNVKYSPGPILENKPAMEIHPEDSLRYRTYKISSGDNNSNIDYSEWPTDFGAPKDELNNPMVKGDQTLWTVYNGFDQSNSPSTWDGNNIPIEIRQTSFSHSGNESDATDIFSNVIFFEWEIINKGTESIDSSYIGFWTDIDFFGAFNNLPAVDTLHQLGYCWDEIDSNYNPFPGIRPAVGYTLLYGPIVPSPNSTAIFRGKQKNNFKNLPLSSFHPIGDDSDPSPLQGVPWNLDEVWNIAEGLDLAGNIIIDSFTQQPTNFPYNGDPGTRDGWIFPSGSSGGGAGFVFFSGPFTLFPNDTQWIMIALVPGLGNDRYESIENMRKKVEVLRSLPYDSLAFGTTKYFITDVNDDNNSQLPTKFELSQNYPNPFNPTTTIKYMIPSSSVIPSRQSRDQHQKDEIPDNPSADGRNDKMNVKLTVYDILGREVTTLVNKIQKPGNYKVEFNAGSLSSGVYLYKLKTDNFIETKKMILLR